MDGAVSLIKPNVILDRQRRSKYRYGHPGKFHHLQYKRTARFGGLLLKAFLVTLAVLVVGVRRTYVKGSRTNESLDLLSYQFIATATKFMLSLLLSALII